MNRAHEMHSPSKLSSVVAGISVLILPPLQPFTIPCAHEFRPPYFALPIEKGT
jgi:hypothetical protein